LGAHDADLVRDASSGDESAWHELVDRYARTVWSVVRSHRLGSGDAADVYQTTWLRLVENLDRIAQPERVGSWLVTTARRESLRLLHVRQREVPHLDDVDLPHQRVADGPGPEDVVVLDDERAVVARAFHQLSARCQLLLRLWLADTARGNADIAAHLGTPVGSVGPTKSRCLAQLRRLLEESGAGADSR
jgi:RNA polymerase sigma factor (sigma-70 family)